MHLFAISLSFLGLTACADHAPGPSPDDPEAAGNTVTCGTDRADAAAPGLERKGANGHYTFRLMAFEPAVLKVGSNGLTFAVVDAGGAAVSDATITVKAYMPKHGHGSSATPTIVPEGTGYKATGVLLFMPGLWEITLTATAPGGTDSALFSFCVDG
ncbi:MAG TPA: FixH family protein [Myxococcota bacterium]|nr:FixH family protein [Myxococcota bacterium]